jgi:hypothetical protein
MITDQQWCSQDHFCSCSLPNWPANHKILIGVVSQVWSFYMYFNVESVNPANFDISKSVIRDAI